MGNSPTLLGKYVGCEDQLYAILGVSDKPPSMDTKQAVLTSIVPKWRNVIWVELEEMAELLGVNIGTYTTHDQLVRLIAGRWVDKVTEHRAKLLQPVLEQKARGLLRVGDKVVGAVGNKVMIERATRFWVLADSIKVTRENADGTD